jgi:hypothetical protein
MKPRLKRLKGSRHYKFFPEILDYISILMRVFLGGGATIGTCIFFPSSSNVKSD